MITIKKQQLDFLDWEFGAFFHFGIRTFYEGHIDWDMKEMSLDGFNPTALDCEQWIKAIKEAGAKYAILVCKHHDGFANWPSKYTEYSVKNTPWKNGEGDVVRDFTDACRKHDIKVGLYYSPAQFGSVKMDHKEYDNYFINQISELLTDYGKIDYLWFDGCGSENHEYDTERIISVIRSLQPEILIFNMWDPDTRWAGNEAGMAEMPNYNVVDSLDFSIQTNKKDKLEQKKFLPAECDCKIRTNNWFYAENDDSLKSVDELMGMYYYSVGKGANLLLNIAPDRRGLLPEEDMQHFIDLGKRIKELYKSKIETEVTKSNNVYTLSLKERTLVNHVIICEDVSEQHIERFHVRIYPNPISAPITVYESTTVGHKHICVFPEFYAHKVEVVIDEENGIHTIKDIDVYYHK